ncbi:MAG: isochorismatase [Gaiellaceae bacterium]
MLPLPPHFDPEAVGAVWRVSYEDRAHEAEAWAAEHGLRPATEDAMRICLVAVDVQNTFCIPAFELFVAGRSGTGAIDDNRRLCEFVYRNLDAITQIVPTLDTHQAMQVFHAIWLVDADGNHPEPYTLVSADDVAGGRWQVDEAVAEALGLELDYARRHLVHYTRALEETGKYRLTIWPYHGMLGGIGHALVPAVEEAIFFHTVARHSQPDVRVKGTLPLTEHYSVLGPEVTEGPDGDRLGRHDAELVEKLLGFDAVVIAGQAKSHCVAWTIDDLLHSPVLRERALAAKAYLLEDCMSPVVVPGVADYTDEADAAFARFAEAGMHVVRSTQPIESWPGIAASARS